MSYFSNILTATKSRYASLREKDADANAKTEDESEITQALRAYYAAHPEKPYPAWLPPPPDPPAPQRPRLSRSTRRVPTPLPHLPHLHLPHHHRQRAPHSLSDIWDAPVEAPELARTHSSPVETHQSIRNRILGGRSRGPATPLAGEDEYRPPERERGEGAGGGAGGRE